MQTKNVYYTEEPGRFIVNKRGANAVIEFPVDVQKLEGEERTEWLAKTVYAITTRYTENLADRIEADFELWLGAAKQTEPQPVDLNDVVEALNALTEIVIGG